MWRTIPAVFSVGTRGCTGGCPKQRHRSCPTTAAGASGCPSDKPRSQNVPQTSPGSGSEHRPSQGARQRFQQHIRESLLPSLGCANRRLPCSHCRGKCPLATALLFCGVLPLFLYLGARGEPSALPEVAPWWHLTAQAEHPRDHTMCRDTSSPSFQTTYSSGCF